MKEVKVIKASGNEEAFSEEKLKSSICRAGVLDNALSNWVVGEIKKSIKRKVSTNYIRDKVFDILSKKSLNFALRYRLKQSIMELGPSGHPFEKFVARILQEKGYETKTNVLMQGKCVLHEVDILAQKNGEKIMIEAKYHNEQGIKTDVKVAMYVKARFDDINVLEKIDKVWLITNTKLTFDAKQYASCVGMEAIGWNYPHDKSLQNMIEENKLYPITILYSLDMAFKRKLLEEGIVLVKDITPEIISSLHLKSKVLEKIQQEIKMISE